MSEQMTDLIGVPANILKLIKYPFKETPTSEVTAILVHKQEPGIRVYIEGITKKECFDLLKQIPSCWAIMQAAFVFQSPGRREIPTFPGFVSANYTELSVSSVKKSLCFVSNIPFHGAWANGGNWKSRAKQAVTQVGELPAGLLFDSSVLSADLHAFIDGIDQ